MIYSRLLVSPFIIEEVCNCYTADGSGLGPSALVIKYIAVTSNFPPPETATAVAEPALLYIAAPTRAPSTRDSRKATLRDLGRLWTVNSCLSIIKSTHAAVAIAVLISVIFRLRDCTTWLPDAKASNPITVNVQGPSIVTPCEYWIAAAPSTRHAWTKLQSTSHHRLRGPMRWLSWPVSQPAPRKRPRATPILGVMNMSPLSCGSINAMQRNMVLPVWFDTKQW